MKKKVHVIPHTHWDREWYFTTARSKVYLMKNLEDILHTLEQDGDFTYYMLDAQGSLLDDYRKWMPQDEERIKRLVREHRLLIGPWYTQSDQLVISAESIVRNLYYGIQTCQFYGDYMKVAYVPDSFGQAGNMPQIYQAFGLKDTLFWRGVSDDMVSHTDFMWKGDDGSKVFATQIPFGYYIGGNIPEEEGQSDTFWEKECFEKAGKGSASKHIYFPNGFDQAPIRKNLPKILRERNRKDPENEYIISCIEDYIKDVKASGVQLEEVEGELVIAKHMRIHKSIFSSRSDLKILNTKVQNYVTNIMEPVLTLSYHLGNSYPKEAIMEVWKLLFENAAHDSIGSCISDRANEDVRMRYKQAQEIAENLVELHERLIATAIQQDPQDILSMTLFNTLATKRNDICIQEVYLPDGEFSLRDSQGQTVAYTILDKEDISSYVLSQTIRLNPSKPLYLPKHVYRATIAIEAKQLPALGYHQLTLQHGESSASGLHVLEHMENAFYEIQIQDNGTFHIMDKQSGICYKNQGVLVENGDDGDSFNYSPPRKDMHISSKDCQAEIMIEGSSLYQCATIQYNMWIPTNLEERAEQLCRTNLPVVMKLSLKKDDPIVYVHIAIDNQAYSHRLCAVFDADMLTKTNIADQQFGIIERVNVYEKEQALYEAALHGTNVVASNGPLNWNNTSMAWQEPPISIEPTQSFVSLCDGARGVALFPGGVREYEIIDNGKISLTLYRSYGMMGKENLLYRPGRASGEKIIETPDAQLLGPREFDFGWYAYASSFNEAAVAQEAKRYQTPVEVYEYADFLNGRLLFVQEDIEQTLPKTTSLGTFKNNHLVVSAVKKQEHKKGYILRFYNPYLHQETTDVFQTTFDIKCAYYVNLLEEKISEPLLVQGRDISIEQIKHCKFVSIYVEKV